MKRRLEIAIGLLHRPKVLFLDEPTIGLDPQTRRRIWEYVNTVRETEGLTVFLTTHYMDEAEICDRIAIIDRGHIVACDSPSGLKADVGRDLVKVWTDGNGTQAAAARYLAEMGATVLPELTDGALALEVAAGRSFVPEAIRALDAELGVGCVSAIALEHPTLDDVFVRLTGRDIRDEGASANDRLRAMAHAHGGGHSALHRLRHLRRCVSIQRAQGTWPEVPQRAPRSCSQVRRMHGLSEVRVRVPRTRHSTSRIER
jgi:ABC-2 type transport system ATP-binding protein